MNDKMAVAPAILKLHSQLDDAQLELISHWEGPALGIAGPGAGKTLTIVLRAVNLLLLERVETRELLLCTYSRAAALELRHRFYAMATAVGYGGDISTVRITTLHGLCGRLLRAHAGRAGFRSGFRLLNDREQWNLLDERFQEVFGPDRERLARRGWRRPAAVVRNAIRYFDRICDELIDPRDLLDSGNRFKVALGRSYRRYEHLLLELNLADFAHLQRWTLELLERDDDVAKKISGGIRNLMCDEYQDTSHAQERLLRLLAENHGNICVVGDDDQSLYRFRGASVENMLRFPERYPDCRVVELGVNHRSHPAILRAFTDWMRSGDWASSDPDRQFFRYDKAITPGQREGEDYPAVIRIGGHDAHDEEDQLVNLLRFLKRHQVINDYSQVALLLHSVRDEVAGRYLDALEDGDVPAGIPPRGWGQGTGAVRRRARSEVAVTTIHQAKGLEWDVVVVGSLDFHNRDVDPVGRVLRPQFRRPVLEPERRIAAFDHMRQHYVAFSRARHLLVLSAGEPPRTRFNQIWSRAEAWEVMGRVRRDALARQRFRPSETAASPGTDGLQPTPSPRLSELRSRRIVIHMGRRHGISSLRVPTK